MESLVSGYSGSWTIMVQSSSLARPSLVLWCGLVLWLEVLRLRLVGDDLAVGLT